jgi:hypothetical protein
MGGSQAGNAGGDLMPPIVNSIKIDTSILDKMTAEMQSKANDITYKFGSLISGDWAMAVPVDTSALKNSILSESGMEGMLYVAQDGVEYGVYVELGTSKMAARPALIPAVEKWREQYLTAFNGLF